MSSTENSLPGNPLGQWQPTILVVDDTQVNRLVFSAALKKEARVVCAESGFAALRLAEEVSPHIILLDVMMPEMDGYATAAALRSNPRLAGIPIIFLTALTDNESQIRGLALGAVDFISKPVNMTVLRRRVANALERERLRLAAMVQKVELQLELQRAREVRDLLESVFEASRNALFVADGDFRIIRFNHSAEILVRGSGALGVGASLREFSLLDEDNAELPLETLQAAGRGIECQLRIGANTAIPVAALFQAFVVDGGERHYLLSLQNLSARRALEAAKEEAKAVARSVFADLAAQKLAIDQHALACITDLGGNITYVNEHFCAVSRYRPEELLANNVSLLRSDLHPDAFYTDIWASIRRGETWQGEVAYRAKDGSTYWVYSTITQWIAEDGLPYQFSVGTDITAHKQTEEALHQLRDRELKIGSDIQNRLLFAKPPSNSPGFDVAYYSESSQGIDGDFYSFSQVDQHRFDVLTGDVMGKGAAAALIGAGVKGKYPWVMLKLIIGDPEHRMPSPEAIVNALHEAMTPELISLNAFVTLTMLRFDRLAKTVTWVNAGHTPLLLGCSGGTCVERLEGDHLPIGVLLEERYAERVTPLELGDAVLLYSDGLSEAVNAAGEFYGEERIAAILKEGLANELSPSIVLTSLRSDLHDHTDFAVGGDDRTALVIQMLAVRGATRGTIRDRKAPEYLDLPRRLAQLTPLRLRIQALCADQDDDFVQALILAAFETATNIIRHTPKKLVDAPFTVLLKRTAGAALVEFIYEGEPFSPPENNTPDFSGDSFGGFGLFIIEQSVDSVSYGPRMPGMASIALTKFFPDGNKAGEKT